MEKRNIVEDKRTPQATEKSAEVIDAGVKAFMTKRGSKSNDRPKCKKCELRRSGKVR